MDTDPQDGAAVGPGVFLPFGPRVQLIALLRIDLSDFADWGETERIVANVTAVYWAFDPSRPRKTRVAIVASDEV